MGSMNDLVEQLKQIARQAGDVIMEVYSSGDLGTQIKKEPGYISPITRADKAANDIIVSQLEKISRYPIISEENDRRTVESDKFWLVDPLDGTKGFVDQNGEFTVNIALIDKGEPVLGVVYVPAKRLLYWGGKSVKAHKQEGDHPSAPIRAVFKGKVPVVFTSRRHRGQQLEEFLDEMGEYKEVSMDSSLKFCLIAEGAATVYPRFWQTHLWDTAAADAVVRAAGGSVHDLKGKPLGYYPKGDLINPYFIAKTRA